MFVFLNNRFVPEKKAMISVFDPGLLAGEGVFETILVDSGKCQLVGGHLARLMDSARAIDLVMPIDTRELQEKIHTLIRKNKIVRGMLRITLTPTTLLITTRLIPPRPSTASVTCVAMERCLPHLKTLNYLPTILAQRAAEKRGYDEALLVDRTGHITEGGRSNLFFVIKKKLHTPPLGTALSGITRAKIIQLARTLHIPCSEKKITPMKLIQADEIFLTNAPMEIWPVTKFEKKRFTVGKITQLLMQHYK